MNYLFDSNLFIYAAQSTETPVHNFLHSIEIFYYSSISLVESLGYHRIQSLEENRIKELFALGNELNISPSVIQKAIDLRKEKKITLGDSIIAATAIVHQLPLATRNIEDFSSFSGITLFNPYE